MGGVQPPPARLRKVVVRGHVLPRALAGAAQLAGVGQRLHQRARRRTGVSRRIEAPAVRRNDLHGAPGRGGHHRPPGGHGLQQHQPVGLVVGAVQQAGGAGQRLARIGQRPGEGHASGQVIGRGASPELVQQPLALLAHRVPGHHELQLWELARRDRHRLQRQVGSLPRDDRPQQQRGRRVRGWRGRLEPAHVDAGPRHAHRGAQAALGVQVARHRVGDRDHAVQALGRGANRPRHRSLGKHVHVLEQHRRRAAPAAHHRGRRDGAAHSERDHRRGA